MDRVLIVACSYKFCKILGSGNFGLFLMKARDSLGNSCEIGQKIGNESHCVIRTKEPKNPDALFERKSPEMFLSPRGMILKTRNAW